MDASRGDGGRSEPPEAGLDAGIRDGGMEAGLDAGIRDGGMEAGLDGSLDGDGGTAADGGMVSDTGIPVEAGWDGSLDVDAGSCGGHCASDACLFYDDLEDGTDAWILGDRWAHVSFAGEGSLSILGSWGNWDVGCPVTSAALLVRDLNLEGLALGTMHFRQAGRACEFDTLRVLVSTDQGTTWALAATPEAPYTRFTEQAIDLGPWMGQSIRLGFEFTNVCGDPCGVHWYIDDIAVCAEAD